MNASTSKSELQLASSTNIQYTYVDRYMLVKKKNWVAPLSFMSLCCAPLFNVTALYCTYNYMSNIIELHLNTLK